MGDLYVLLDRGNCLLKDLNEKDYLNYTRAGIVWTVIGVAGFIFKQQDVVMTGFILAGATACSAFVAKYRIELQIIGLFSEIVKKKDSVQKPEKKSKESLFLDIPTSPKIGKSETLKSPKTPKDVPPIGLAKLGEQDAEIKKLRERIQELENLLHNEKIEKGRL